MPIYDYKALNNKGFSTSGIIDADSLRDGREKLRKQRLYVTTIKEVKEEQRRRQKSILPNIFKRKNTNELSMVTRQIATLLNAGIPLAQALQAIIEQVQNKQLNTAFRDIREQIIQGLSLADALANHPFYFSSLFVNVVRAGEASGTLDSVLVRLADFTQSQVRLRGKIVAALTYPIIMVIIGTGVIIFLMIAVVPKITELLESQEQALPFVTEVLIKISNFFQHTWFLIPIILLFMIIAFKSWVSTKSGRRMWDRTLFKMPIFGDLFRKVAVSRFSSTFSTLLKSGIPALSALKIVSKVVNNKVLEDTLDDVHDKILEGSDISTPLKKSGVFPPVVGYMMAVGEQSGQLEELLDKISIAYDEEIDLATQKLTAMLEPILVVAMAGGVAFVVVSILLPLLQLSRGMSG
ncbi:MAG: type II secretion system inner membrane protein GspF [Planctomycetes bacterium]|nr:type II secretion system inner membrane protein GspF [Planctomycetota bacterium]